MNVVLFLTVMVVSWVVVRIGAIAFHLTGLEWSMAKFQALSCFTSTGFTTREAELVTGNPQRRRIASILIVLGHAGLVTMIATFANAVSPRATGWSIPFLHGVIAGWLLPWINLAIVVAALYIIYKVFTRSSFVHRVTDILRKHVEHRAIVKRVSFEEMALVTGGYGVSRIAISEENKTARKTLIESGLREHDITVLAIVRGSETTANPSADTMIMAGDTLLCFGKLDNIRKQMYESI